MMEIRTVTGPDMTQWLNEVARLRIQVFRAYPYLYDGDPDYEARYLAQFATAPDSTLVLALNDDRVVGCATAMAMRGADAEFRRPFEQAGEETERFFYFGESVLEPAFRGQGIGHRFFDAREARARECGARFATFCAVQRPADHPDRPGDYRPLDAFWQGRGYRRRDDLGTRFAWKDIGQAEETAKPMVFWTRELAA